MNGDSAIVLPTHVEPERCEPVTRMGFLFIMHFFETTIILKQYQLGVLSMIQLFAYGTIYISNPFCGLFNIKIVLNSF